MTDQTTTPVTEIEIGHPMVSVGDALRDIASTHHYATIGGWDLKALAASADELQAKAIANGRTAAEKTRELIELQARTPLPVFMVAPEVLERFDRLAVAFEGIAAAILPDDAGVVAAVYCGAPIWRRDAHDREPYLCTRLEGHEPGHVARAEDGTVLACQLGRPAEAEGFVCPACGESATAEVRP